MKLAILLLAALASVGFAPPPTADTFAVFKCSVTLPVVFQTLNGKGQQVLATKTLKSDDLVNLALGRPLGTKLDSTTEVLAFASDVSTPGAGSKLIVFNPTAQDVTTIVFLTDNFVLLSNETFTQNEAFSNALITETSLGDPVHNSLHAKTMAMAGTGKSSGSFASTSVAGPFSFTSTTGGVTTTTSGLVLKGKLKASGPQLALLMGM
jgi:hypothetical protein